MANLDETLVTIAEGQALDDVKSIGTIMANVESEMALLNTKLTGLISDNENDTDQDIIVAEWARILLDQWTKYYDADIPNALADIKEQAAYLQNAVERTMAYNSRNA